MFTIDISTAFRFPDELLALAGAVQAADPADEDVWMEWKSTYDMSVAAPYQQIAKHILGFANRDPEVAERRANRVPWGRQDTTEGSLEQCQRCARRFRCPRSGYRSSRGAHAADQPSRRGTTDR